MDFHRVACFKSLQRDNRQMLEQGEVFAATWPAVLSAAGDVAACSWGAAPVPQGQCRGHLVLLTSDSSASNPC